MQNPKKDVKTDQEKKLAPGNEPQKQQSQQERKQDQKREEKK
ncbi:hypothetical protein [Alteromonas gracilis]